MLILLGNKTELFQIEKYCIYHNNHQELLIKSVSQQKNIHYFLSKVLNLKLNLKMERKSISEDGWIFYIKTPISIKTTFLMYD